MLCPTLATLLTAYPSQKTMSFFESIVVNHVGLKPDCHLQSSAKCTITPLIPLPVNLSLHSAHVIRSPVLYLHNTYYMPLHENPRTPSLDLTESYSEQQHANSFTRTILASLVSTLSYHFTPNHLQQNTCKH